MADDVQDELSKIEGTGTVDKANAEMIQVRRVIGDVYTFVRSRELNKTVASFTFDHYIDEAKRRIKEPRVLRTASSPGKGAGTRPGQLEQIEKLEESFSKALNHAKKLAAVALDTEEAE